MFPWKLFNKLYHIQRMKQNVTQQTHPCTARVWFCVLRKQQVSHLFFFFFQTRLNQHPQRWIKWEQTRTERERERVTEDGNYGVWESGLLCVEGNSTDRGMKACGVREHWILAAPSGARPFYCLTGAFFYSFYQPCLG